jgi:hypothetical protein
MNVRSVENFDRSVTGLGIFIGLKKKSGRDKPQIKLSRAQGQNHKIVITMFFLYCNKIKQKVQV